MIYLISISAFASVLYFFSIGISILGFIKIKNKKRAQTKKDEYKKITVIIPARNEEDNILNCLQSIKNQNYNTAMFEVIVVDDNSTDATINIVTSFINDVDFLVRIVSLNEKKSKKEALKYGVKLSKFEIIATTDADCTLPPNWLKNISHNFNTDRDMLLGPVMFKKQKGFLSAFQTLDMFAIQGVEFGMLNFQQPILNNAANLSYLKSAYKAVDGFDTFETPSGDDIFLLEKFKSNLLNINGLVSYDFVVETKSEQTIKSLLNQRVRWASKSKYYSDKLLTFFSGLVLIQNLFLLINYGGILFIDKHTISFVILLFSKWLIDFILLFLVSDFFKRRNVMYYFIPTQLIYPFYILIVWVASITMSFEWKGRRF